MIGMNPIVPMSALRTSSYASSPYLALPPCVYLQLESVKYTRKNENVKPFEAGGEQSLEFYCNRSNCSLFCLASHTKKRPHNLVLGRMFDFHMYDALELGVTDYKGIKQFGSAATSAQVRNCWTSPISPLLHITQPPYRRQSNPSPSLRKGRAIKCSPLHRLGAWGQNASEGYLHMPMA